MIKIRVVSIQKTKFEQDIKKTLICFMMIVMIKMFS